MNKEITSTSWPGLTFTPQGLERLTEVSEFLDKLDEEGNEKANEVRAAFIEKMDYLNGYGGPVSDDDNRRRFLVDLSRDWAPLSFSLVWTRLNHETGEYKMVTRLSSSEGHKVFYGMAVMHDYIFERSTILLVENVGLTENARDSLCFYEIGPNLSFLAEGAIANRVSLVRPNQSIEAQLLIEVDGWEEARVPFTIRIDHNGAGGPKFIPVVLHADPTTGFGTYDPLLPVKFGIAAVFPNPFNSVVRIEFALGTAHQASLKLYDLTGREVVTLHEGFTEAGRHSLAWDGSHAPSGVYFLKL